MSNPTVRSIASAALLAGTVLFQPSLHAASELQPQQASHPVDLVIALDASGSMSGLIESAKQRLWDVVNDLARAQPQPDLRVAVLSYGKPAYGRQTGFVRVDVPLTGDLDRVNEALFGLTTNGGSEYVARVINRATESLQWSDEQNALRIMFVAGNERATQDPDLSLDEVTSAAREMGIVINAIYCGNEQQGDIVSGWKQVADHAGGIYASIDQSASTVASMATPYDDRLRELNAALNETYLPYGSSGKVRRSNQLRQDVNASRMSAPAAASRAITKAGEAYRGSDWDLVDALESGVALESIAPQALPREMQEMSVEEREQHVEKLAGERAAVRTEIKQLAADRRGYIERESKATAKAEEAGLADALTEGLRGAAKRKGFRFE